MKLFKKIINALLKYLGLRLCRINTYNPIHKGYKKLNEEKKLEYELKLFQKLWKNGFFNKINCRNDSRNLYKIYEICLKPNTKEAVILEVGPGRGAWTKLMLDAKKNIA